MDNVSLTASQASALSRIFLCFLLLFVYGTEFLRTTKVAELDVIIWGPLHRWRMILAS